MLTLTGTALRMRQGDDLLIEAVQLLQGQLGDVLPLQQLAVPGSENKR